MQCTQRCTNEVYAYGKCERHLFESKHSTVYDKEFVIKLCHEVMNLGMNVRQRQLQGHCGKSGNEELEEFLKDKL